MRKDNRTLQYSAAASEGGAVQGGKETERVGGCARRLQRQGQADQQAMVRILLNLIGAVGR